MEVHPPPPSEVSAADAAADTAAVAVDADTAATAAVLTDRVRARSMLSKEGVARIIELRFRGDLVRLPSPSCPAHSTPGSILAA